MSRTFVDFENAQNRASSNEEFNITKIQRPATRQVENNYPRKGSDGMSNSLFQFEMKFDSLKGYVDSVTSAVNQHAVLINKLRSDVTAKSQDFVMTEAINKFSSSLNVKEMDSNFMITAVNEGIDSKDNEKAYHASVNKFCQKLEVFGNGMTKVSKLSESLNEKVGNMEINVAKKVGAADLKAKVKKAKTKLRGEMENNNKKFDEKLKILEKKYLQKMESLESKLLRQFENDKSGSKVQENATEVSSVGVLELENRMKQTLEAQNVEVNQINESLKNLQEDFSNQNSKLNNKIQKIVEEEWAIKFEHFTKQVDLKLKEHSNLFEKSLNELRATLEETQKSQNKVSEIEASSRKTSADVKDINENIKNIRHILSEKVDQTEFELKLKHHSPPKEEALASASTSLFDEEKYNNKLQKFVEELHQKIDKVNQNLDRKISKMKKDLDIESLITQFKSKADEDSVQSGFANVDEKLSGLNHNFNVLKKDIETVVDTLNKGALQGVKSSENPFITIKSALPKSCLSCGQGGTGGGQNQLQSINPPPKKVPLKEKVERPFTATSNVKARLFSTTMQNNTSNVHQSISFGATSVGFRLNNRSESVHAKH